MATLPMPDYSQLDMFPDQCDMRPEIAKALGIKPTDGDNPETNPGAPEDMDD